MKKLFTIVFVIVLSLSSTTGWYWRGESKPQPQFQTAEVTRGRLQAALRTSGTLEPEEVVAISARVTGRIEALGTELSAKTGVMHWGSAVQEGTVLARIEDGSYQAEVKKAQAERNKNSADLVQKTALLTKAEADWKRAQTLFPKKTISMAEYDQAYASLEVAKAAIDISKAQIQAAEVALATAQTNLANTIIRSPVPGIVIDQRVRVGQTVNATSPSLFLIAKDLRKMEVWASLTEADAGRVQIGQRVQIAVDALPGAIYQGTVKALGKFASRLSDENQPRGTCNVLVSVENTDGKLAPYLTAKLAFVANDQSDVLLVPNTALSWQPTEQQLHPTARASYADLKANLKAAGGWLGQEFGVVWLEHEGLVRPIQVRVGLRDGNNTEILGAVAGSLSDGTRVITGSFLPTGANADR